MQTRVLLVGLLLAATALPTLAPTAAAFDWCVEGTPKDCDSHYVCIGRSWSQWSGETCSYGIPRHCPIECPVLP